MRNADLKLQLTVCACRSEDLSCACLYRLHLPDYTVQLDERLKCEESKSRNSQLYCQITVHGWAAGDFTFQIWRSFSSRVHSVFYKHN